MFVFFNNWVVRAHSSWLALPPVIIYAVSSLLQASRGDFVVLAISGFIMWCVLKRRNQPDFHLSGRQIATLIGLVVAALASFVSLSSVVGRKLSKTPFDNLMMYVGGSISNFDAYIKDPIVDSNASRLWGGESFYAMYSFMGRRTNRPKWLYSFQLEFRYNGMNESMGNIYTAFRYYYHDFGFLGMLLITAFQAALFTMMYYYVTEHLSSRSYVISTFVQVVYSYLAVSVAYFPIADWLLHQLFAPPALFIILAIGVSSCCVVGTTKSPLLDEKMSKNYSVENHGHAIYHVRQSA
jgi:oligosaccharide repeat unit polymerase